jgi:uncharacterized protein YacL
MDDQYGYILVSVIVILILMMAYHAYGMYVTAKAKTDADEKAKTDAAAKQADLDAKQAVLDANQAVLDTTVVQEGVVQGGFRASNFAHGPMMNGQTSFYRKPSYTRS